MKPAVLERLQPVILSRDTWAEDRPPKGEIEAEDVRFLIVHHTSSPGNEYDADGVTRLLRGIYDFHTGAEKGWPDIAYNFMVDKFGRTFEARAGSVDGSPVGSATGGNQGFTQLCCFLGDHAVEAPTVEAQNSMIELLSWLAYRNELDLSVAATVTFESRGSNRHAPGTTVTNSTLAVHREMSQTTCPGDACVSLVRSTFHDRIVKRIADTESAETASTSTTTTSTTEPPTTTTPSTEPAPTTVSPTVVSSSAAGDLAAVPVPSGSGPGLLIPALGGIGGAGVALAGSLLWLRTRRVDTPPVRPEPVAPVLHHVVAGKSTDSFRGDVAIDVFVLSQRRAFAESSVPALISEGVAAHRSSGSTGEAPATTWRRVSQKIESAAQSVPGLNLVVIATDRTHTYVTSIGAAAVVAERAGQSVDLGALAQIARVDPTTLHLFDRSAAEDSVAEIRIARS